MRVKDWAEQHSVQDEEDQALAMTNEMQNFMDDDADDDSPPSVPKLSFDDIVQGVNGGESLRFEKVDAQALADELRRLEGLKKNRSKQEERWYAFLKRTDSEAVPSPRKDVPMPAVRYLIVTYTKRRSIGRRTASYPSMQGCPSGLRPLLVSYFYHDVDIESCHPTLMLQVALGMGVAAEELEVLERYVHGGKDETHADIASFYGIRQAKACKFGVLRVLNQGSWEAWVNGEDTLATQNVERPHPTLVKMAEVSKLVKDAFFRKFQTRVDELRTELLRDRKEKLRRAESCLASATGRKGRLDAQNSVWRAKSRFMPSAIDRSVFSHCIFELEDTVLAVVDAHFRESGWNVASLIFDGLHVEHRAGSCLVDAMRGAEKKVRDDLGYDIKLVEKPLSYALSSYEEATCSSDHASASLPVEDDEEGMESD